MSNIHTTTIVADKINTSTISDDLILTGYNIGNNIVITLKKNINIADLKKKAMYQEINKKLEGD